MADERPRRRHRGKTQVLRLRTLTDEESAAERDVPGGNPFLTPPPGFVPTPTMLTNCPGRMVNEWVDVEVLRKEEALELQALLDAGTINQAEFDAAKAKLLAA